MPVSPLELICLVFGISKNLIVALMVASEIRSNYTQDTEPQL